MSRALSLLLLAGFLLSGCASGNSPSNTSDPGAAAEQLDLQATKDTGVIRGVVIDLAVRPLSKVLISAKSAGATVITNTTESGAFGFEGLAPGTYFVKASKLGFSEGQTAVEVVAGVSDPAPIKITLEADAKTAPYVLPLINKGYIECSSTSLFYSVAVCSVPNDGPGCGDLYPCAVTTDIFLFSNELSRAPDHLQSEMVWESTQQLGAEMALVWSYGCSSNGGLFCDPGKIEGTSPLLLMGNQTILDLLFRDEGNRTGFIIRVFNADLQETTPPPGTTEDICVDTMVLGKPCARRGLGFTFEQNYEIISHAFFGYTPPEWRITSNTPVPQPPV